jgi:hypothetical protein
MANRMIDFGPLLNRLEAIERKLDALTHRINGLTERLERGENYPTRNLPDPPDVNEDIHVPGLG